MLENNVLVLDTLCRAGTVMINGLEAAFFSVDLGKDKPSLLEFLKRNKGIILDVAPQGGDKFKYFVSSSMVGMEVSGDELGGSLLKILGGKEEAARALLAKPQIPLFSSVMELGGQYHRSFQMCLNRHNLWLLFVFSEKCVVAQVGGEGLILSVKEFDRDHFGNSFFKS